MNNLNVDSRGDFYKAIFLLSDDWASTGSNVCRFVGHSKAAYNVHISVPCRYRCRFLPKRRELKYTY